MSNHWWTSFSGSSLNTAKKESYSLEESIIFNREGTQWLYRLPYTIDKLTSVSHVTVIDQWISSSHCQSSYGSGDYFDNVMTKFIVINRTDTSSKTNKCTKRLKFMYSWPWFGSCPIQMECASCDALGKEHKAANIRLWKRIRAFFSVKRRVMLQDKSFLILDFDEDNTI